MALKPNHIHLDYWRSSAVCRTSLKRMSEAEWIGWTSRVRSRAILCWWWRGTCRVSPPGGRIWTNRSPFQSNLLARHSLSNKMLYHLKKDPEALRHEFRHQGSKALKPWKQCQENHSPKTWQERQLLFLAINELNIWFIHLLIVPDFNFQS